MNPHFTVSRFEFFSLPTRTRFPFRYGIASLTEVPHLFVTAEVVVEGKSAVGLASEGLPPKWFTKNPATTFDQDLPEMLEVIGHAARQAEDFGKQSASFFAFWRELNLRQTQWAASRQIPPLLAGLGVSLVERVVLDGLCRGLGQSLHELVATNRLGLRLGEIHPELGRSDPRDWLPARPLGSCAVRHTVGLADALTPGDIPANERVDDGLPQDLEAAIRAYGLRYFKIKLSGQAERDQARLRELAALLERETGGDFHVTLDGNEFFPNLAAFREFWESSAGDPALVRLWPRVLAVEQPVHRDRSLDDDAGTLLRQWGDGPPLIIDESDGALGDVARALALGYAGASHKNCKGIVKGLANACLLAARRRSGQRGLLTGEDLCTLGPVALLQDLAMMALLGIEHVERNGHHYYRGLSMFPGDWQDAVLAAHGDLYARHAAGFPCLTISSGRLALGSVNAAPFGLGRFLDPSRFTPRDLG